LRFQGVEHLEHKRFFDELKSLCGEIFYGFLSHPKAKDKPRLLIRGIRRGFLIVAHSMGGLVGLDYSLRNKKKFVKLISISTPFYGTYLGYLGKFLQGYDSAL